MPPIITQEDNMGKVVKDVEDISVSFADNGFILEYRGNDDKGDWTTSRIVVLTLDEAVAVIRDVATNKSLNKQ